MTSRFHHEDNHAGGRGGFRHGEQDDLVVDMTREGEFVQPPRASIGEIALRLLGFVILLGIGALAFWLAVFTIPVLIVVGLIGYLVFRLQMARHGVRVPPIIIMRRGR